MTNSCVSSPCNKLITRLSTLLFLLIIPLALAGQKPVDFSGTWRQDNSKGNDILKGYYMVLSITQTDKNITIKQAIFNDQGKDEGSEQSSFSLDGKEVVKKEPQWVTRQSAIWSPDKKEITIKTSQTTGKQVVESHEMYSISKDGQVLTLKRFNVQAKENILIKVFNMKK
jgi:hypothetical protein